MTTEADRIASVRLKAGIIDNNDPLSDSDISAILTQFGNNTDKAAIEVCRTLASYWALNNPSIANVYRVRAGELVANLPIKSQDSVDTEDSTTTQTASQALTDHAANPNAHHTPVSGSTFTLSDETPQPVGSTGDAGVSGDPSRGDHAHADRQLGFTDLTDTPSSLTSGKYLSVITNPNDPSGPPIITEVDPPTATSIGPGQDEEVLNLNITAYQGAGLLPSGSFTISTVENEVIQLVVNIENKTAQTGTAEYDLSLIDNGLSFDTDDAEFLDTNNLKYYEATLAYEIPRIQIDLSSIHEESEVFSLLSHITGDLTVYVYGDTGNSGVTPNQTLKIDTVREIMGSGGGGNSVNLSDNTPTSVAAASDPGDSSLASRDDHIHRIPFSNDTPETWVTGGDSGDDDNVSRADHAHPRIDLPQPSSSTPLSSHASGHPGTNAAYSRGDHIHPDRFKSGVDASVDDNTEFAIVGGLFQVWAVFDNRGGNLDPDWHLNQDEGSIRTAETNGSVIQWPHNLTEIRQVSNINTLRMSVEFASSETRTPSTIVFVIGNTGYSYDLTQSGDAWNTGDIDTSNFNGNGVGIGIAFDDGTNFQWGVDSESTTLGIVREAITPSGSNDDALVYNSTNSRYESEANRLLPTGESDGRILQSEGGVFVAKNVTLPPSDGQNNQQVKYADGELVAFTPTPTLGLPAGDPLTSSSSQDNFLSQRRVVDVWVTWTSIATGVYNSQGNDASPMYDSATAGERVSPSQGLHYLEFFSDNGEFDAVVSTGQTAPFAKIRVNDGTVVTGTIDADWSVPETQRISYATGLTTLDTAVRTKVEFLDASDNATEWSHSTVTVTRAGLKSGLGVPVGVPDYTTATEMQGVRNDTFYGIADFIGMVEGFTITSSLKDIGLDMPANNTWRDQDMLCIFVWAGNSSQTWPAHSATAMGTWPGAMLKRITNRDQAVGSTGTNQYYWHMDFTHLPNTSDITRHVLLFSLDNNTDIMIRTHSGTLYANMIRIWRLRVG